MYPLDVRMQDAERVGDLDYERYRIDESVQVQQSLGEKLRNRPIGTYIRFFGMKRGMNHAVSVWIRRLFLQEGNVEYLNNVHFINQGAEFSGMQYGSPHSATGEFDGMAGAGGTALEFWSKTFPERSFMQRVIRSDDLEPLERVDNPKWRTARLAASIQREVEIRNEREIDQEQLAAQIVGFEDFILEPYYFDRIPDARFLRGKAQKTLNIGTIRDLRALISSRIRFADAMNNERHMEVTGQIAQALVNLAHLGLSKAFAAGAISNAQFDKLFPEGPHPLADRFSVINADRWAKETEYRKKIGLMLGFSAKDALAVSTEERSQYGIGKGSSSSSFGDAGESGNGADRQKYRNDARVEEVFRRYPRLRELEQWIGEI